jgi:hypothetical protein
MWKARLLRIGLPAAGAILVAVGAVLITASAVGLKLVPTPAAPTPAAAPAASPTPIPSPGGRAAGKPTAASAEKAAYLTAAAGALGLKPAQLRQDLKGGQTLSQVAATQGVSEADFKTKVAAALKPRLDAAVTAGTITQAQEDAELMKLASGDPPLWTTTK